MVTVMEAVVRRTQDKVVVMLQTFLFFSVSEVPGTCLICWASYIFSLASQGWKA